MKQIKPNCQNFSLIDIPGEIWLPVTGFEGYYEVSNMGRMKSVERVVNHPSYGNKKVKEKIMVQPLLKSKYLSICLRKEGVIKGYRVHRLVAQHFVPNNKPEINHKNGIKTDNRASELEWATRVENIAHSIKTGLTRQNGKESNFYGLQGIKSYRAKKINQYTREGKFIKTWYCIQDAVRELKPSRTTIRNGGLSKGYYWKINAKNTNDIIVKKRWQRVLK